jgi:hypothetical protein
MGANEQKKGVPGDEGEYREMTRGRPPKKARWEAARSAAHQGEVLEAAGIGRSRIDFILFVRQWVIFVRVKRSHSRIRSIQELRVLFSDEIAGLHTIPLIAVVSRELWVLLPWGAWQYFCIGDDGIREIHTGNRMGSGTEEHAEGVQGQGEGTPDESMKRNGEDENAAGIQDVGDSGSRLCQMESMLSLT